ncbi:MAG TPA: branched-chain amino acid ABC transporter permease [Sphaerochaeta sp.]|nr:branched-chain amino acid ABC transporter permease [Sphaerochaeta sp.]
MSNYQLGLIMNSCISVITVTGVFAVTGLAGMFSLGQAGYLAISSYVTFILARTFGLPIILTAVIGVGLSALSAYVISVPTLKLRKDYFALITMGFGQMVTAMLVLLERYTNGSIGYSKIPKVKPLVAVVIGITVLVVFCIRNLKYSRFGRMCIALKTDEIAAKSFGIDVYKLKLRMYVLASAIAGVAGILYGLKNRVILPDSFGWNLSAEMQIFLFFGGTNSITGAVFSGFFLKLLPELFRTVKIFGQSLQEYRTIIYCVLILLVINFRPNGMMGEHELQFAWAKRLFSRQNRLKKKETPR